MISLAAKKREFIMSTPPINSTASAANPAVPTPPAAPNAGLGIPTITPQPGVGIIGRVTSAVSHFFQNIGRYFEVYFTHIMMSMLSVGVTLLFTNNIIVGIPLIAISALGLFIDYFFGAEAGAQTVNGPNGPAPINNRRENQIQRIRITGILNGMRPNSGSANNCWANSLLNYFSMSEAFRRIVPLLPDNHPMAPLKAILQQLNQDSTVHNPYSTANLGAFLRQVIPAYSAGGASEVQDPLAGFEAIREQLERFLLDRLQSVPTNPELIPLQDLVVTLTQTTTRTSADDQNDREVTPRLITEVFPMIHAYPDRANSLDLYLRNHWNNENGEHQGTVRRQREALREDGQRIILQKPTTTTIHRVSQTEIEGQNVEVVARVLDDSITRLLYENNIPVEQVTTSSGPLNVVPLNVVHFARQNVNEQEVEVLLKNVLFPVSQITRRYSREPKELHVHVNRFAYSSTGTVKNKNLFTIPDELVTNRSNIYHELDVVMCHLGNSADGGHFITYRKFSRESYTALYGEPAQDFVPGWYKCDDARAELVTTEQDRRYFEGDKDLQAYYVHYTRRQRALETPVIVDTTDPQTGTTSSHQATT